MIETEFLNVKNGEGVCCSVISKMDNIDSTFQWVELMMFCEESIVLKIEVAYK